MPSASENAVSEWIAAKLRELRGEGDDEKSYDKIAIELGITKPQIFNLVKHGRGAGRKVEEVFAEKYFDGSVDALRKTAREWWTKRNLYVHQVGSHEVLRFIREEQSPPYVSRRIFEQGVRYPSLRDVLDAPENATRWSEPARAAALTMQLKSDTDPGAEWWTRMLDELDVNIRSLARIAGDPLAGLDDEPPPKRPVRSAREKR